MILEMDIGNSRVKWRLRDPDGSGDTVMASQVCEHAAVIEQQADLLGQFADVEQIWVSSVVDSLDEAVHSLAERLQVPLLQACTSAQCTGVTNSYAEPARMGVDRWLAMLAGFNQQAPDKAESRQSQSAICVVDCGTSLTVDFVAANGAHEGGLILPGRGLLLGSLSRNTEQVLFDPASRQGELALGKSTDQAVFNGAEHMLLGAIQQAVASAPAAADRSFFLTGGDGPRLLAGLQQRLNCEASVVPDLVLDGLRLALP